MARSSSASSDEGSARRKASESPEPRSPSRSPVREKKEDEKESKRGRSPIRAPSRSPSRSPDRRRHSRSRSNERRGRRSRSRDRDDRRRERSRSAKRRRSRSRSAERRKRSRSNERSRRRSYSRSPKRTKKDMSPEKKKEPTPEPVRAKKEDPADILRSRAGGAYIPPAKLRLMQAQMQDKSSEQYQRLNWERIKKRIHGEVNKVNVGNLVNVVRSLLQENIVRGKGLLCRSIMQAQAFSPGFSHVYAALVAVINSKFPFIGDLLVRRLVVQFKRCFRRGDKGTAVIVTKFIAHLINQQVAHETLGLEVSILMLDKPTDDSVEVAIAFIKECGMKLQQVAPRALASVFDRLRSILNEATDLDKRTQYMIESSMAILKDKFQAYPAVIEDLDLIDEEDQVTHMTTLEDAIDPENGLNVFKLDPDFEQTEAEYEEVRKNVIGDEDDSDEEEEEEEEDDPDPGTAAEQVARQAEKMEIIDNSEQALVAFRREVYLTIQSSLDFQEAAHKLLKMGIKPQLEAELCNMLVDCCAQQRTYDRMYGMLIERFCRLKKEFQDNFEQILKDVYKTIHRFEITKLRNVARLEAHLLFTDAIDWTIFSEVRLNERDSTSSGRIFLKEVFQELSREMGMVKLWNRTVDKTLKPAFAGVFPRDNPEDTRFSINFFTAIGLGALTIDMREWLEKGAKKKKTSSDDEESSSSESESDSSDSDSDSDSDDSDSSSSSSSSDSSDDDKKKKKKKKAKAEKEVKREQKSATPEKRQKEAHRRRSPSREIKKEQESEDERRGGGRREEKRDERRRDSPPPRRDREEKRRDDREERRREDRGGRGDERRKEEEKGRRDRRAGSRDKENAHKRRDDSRERRRERSVERRDRRRRSRS